MNPQAGPRPRPCGPSIIFVNLRIRERLKAGGRRTQCNVQIDFHRFEGARGTGKRLRRAELNGVEQWGLRHASRHYWIALYSDSATPSNQTE
jgi:hypothetical protein